MHRPYTLCLPLQAFVAAMLYADTNEADEVWIGGIATSQGATEYQWSDYTTFNMVNWAEDQPSGGVR